MNTWLSKLIDLCRKEKKWLLVSFSILLVLVLGAIFFLTASSGISWALYPSSK
jgi:hypothetical protein